ncbi:hypothetical protein Hte_003031 [Hypoxylon texense]
MSTASLRHLVRLYNPIRQATRKPPLPVFRHTGHILHSRPATVRARVSPSRTSFEKVRFTASDVPPLDFWTEHLQQPWFESDDESPYKVGAAACHSACRRYAALAIQDKPGWRQQALTTSPTISSSGAYSSRGGDDGGGKVSLHTLNYVVAMLIRSATAGHLATHIVHSGVMLGYPPSVLTMARLGLERDLLDRPQFLPTKEALHKLATLDPVPTFPSSSKSKSNKPGATKQPGRGSSSSSSDDDDYYYLPDALTAVGLIHARRKEPQGDKRAVRYFDQARAAAASTSTTTATPLAPPSGGPGIWQWRASAVLALVEVYLRRGQRDLARALLRESVPELDNAEACYQYAQLLLPPEDGGEGEGGGEDENEKVEKKNYAERVALLERAAVSGVEEAAREMSRVELRRLEEDDEKEKKKKKAGGKGLSEREKKDRRFMVEEWLVIAGDKGVV